MPFTVNEISPAGAVEVVGYDCRSDDAAERTLRLGIGRFTSAADIEYAVAALVAAHAATPAEA